MTEPSRTNETAEPAPEVRATKKYDAVEIHGVRNDVADDTRAYVSVDDENPEFYSVYLHINPQHPDERAMRLASQSVDWPKGERIQYLGCTIVQTGDEGYGAFIVFDQQGNRVTGALTLRKAKNVVNQLTKGN